MRKAMNPLLTVLVAQAFADNLRVCPLLEHNQVCRQDSE